MSFCPDDVAQLVNNYQQEYIRLKGGRDIDEGDYRYLCGAGITSEEKLREFLGLPPLTAGSVVAAQAPVVFDISSIKPQTIIIILIIIVLLLKR